MDERRWVDYFINGFVFISFLFVILFIGSIVYLAYQNMNGPDSIDSGTVVEKSQESRRIVEERRTLPNGKQITVKMIDDRDWIVVISDNGSTQRYYLSKGEWQAVEIGESFQSQDYPSSTTEDPLKPFAEAQ